MSIIVISNRVARPRPDQPVAGGLAAALLPAVEHAGAVWVGASDRRLNPGAREALAEIKPLGKGALAAVDMPHAHYDKFYEGFSNSVLWPAFHSRPELIELGAEDYASYRAINAFMARSLLRFAQAATAFWVHDYHFLPLGADLRELGVTLPIGFFLHTPFPHRSVMAGVPRHSELVEAMLAYDLIGFQTHDDLDNFRDYLTRDLGVKFTGDSAFFRGHETRLNCFPIGIDAGVFADRATKAAASPEVARLRASLQGRKLAIGVDRLDYSKGLPNRFRAFDRLFEMHPEARGSVHLLQIAVPTRERIAAYQALQAELAQLVGEINGRHAEVDWTPIRYLKKAYPQSMLAGFYRSAQVGLVTPLHDGMNLVAKEYVAAQNPLDPGVLVLSEFAGAAKQLEAAVLVNPHDIDGTAQALKRALEMPAAERRARWNAMNEGLKESSLDLWFSDFTEALLATRRRKVPAPIAAARGALAVPAPRSLGVATRH